MTLKHLFASTCLVLLLGMVVCKPVMARHAVTDASATATSILNLAEDITAAIKKMLDLEQFIRRNDSQGDKKAYANQVDFSKMQKKVLEAAKSSVPETLKNTGFEEKMKDTQQMMSFVKDELMVTNNTTVGTKDTGQPEQEKVLTDQEKEDRQKKRKDLKYTAAADAYATAVGYLSDKTKAQEELLDPVKKVLDGADTVQAKEAAANEAGLARLNEAVQRNILLAELLKLQAAEKIGDMPLDG